MLITLCRGCGQDVIAAEGAKLGICEFCGASTPLPQTNDQRVAALFRNAEEQRINRRFDDAEKAYRQILLEEDSAETRDKVYWGLVECRYGIEYVIDPPTGESIPTCHRMDVQSILANSDYERALEYAADDEVRQLYENNANRIAKIQQRYFDIANREEEYDVFICFKQTIDGSGVETDDKIIAGDIFDELTRDKLRVFYSPVSIEEKAGKLYEPYIYRALYTAKAMLVIGTKPEYFKGTWVQNEWSRYLLRMEKDKDIKLIVCYRDMNPEQDIPAEFSNCLKFDISGFSFLSNITNEAKKAVSQAKVAVANIVSENKTKMKYVWKQLEFENWSEALKVVEEVILSDPENADAYAAMHCVENKITGLDKQSGEELLRGKYFQKAREVADPEKKAELQGYVEKAEQKEKQQAYENMRDRYVALVKRSQAATSSEEFYKLSKRFEEIGAFEHAQDYVNYCHEQHIAIKAIEEQNVRNSEAWKTHNEYMAVKNSKSKDRLHGVFKYIMIAVGSIVLLLIACGACAICSQGCSC
jgi:hypothetical protein